MPVIFRVSRAPIVGFVNEIQIGSSCFIYHLQVSYFNMQLCNEENDVPQGAASVRVKERREKLKLPPIDNVKQLGVGTSTRPFPKTSSGEIGWRSTQPQCQLERYGRYTKPVIGVLKSLNWPPESVD